VCQFSMAGEEEMLMCPMRRAVRQVRVMTEVYVLEDDFQKKSKCMLTKGNSAEEGGTTVLYNTD